MSQVDSRRVRMTRPEKAYLLDASTDQDSALLEEWVATHAGRRKQPTHTIALRPSALETLAARTDSVDVMVVPVRVVRDPSLRAGPRAWISRRIGTWLDSRSSSRTQVVVGEPATLRDLRVRFAASGTPSFARFIARQATLTLDRAEREIIGQEYKLPRFVVEELTERPSFRSDLEKLAESTSSTPDEVDRRVRSILDEMVATEDPHAVTLWGRLGAYFSRAYRVQVDTEALAAVRALNKSYPLVFLPNHRSYLDPLVLRPALLEHGFPMNHVMGGINVGFWPLGPIAKRSGVVLIQRKFSDEIYKWTLRQYMSFLISKKFNLEWYIEGGRTRTGKLRPPRFGLLTYLFDALEHSNASDVFLVPTSITYDRLHEVTTMARESHGATKEAEGIRMAIGYVRAQGKIRGNVYLTFGTPMSVRGFLHQHSDKRVAVQKAALAVSHAINESTPVTPAALVAMAMLGIEDRALNLAEMWSIIAPLATYVRTRDLPVAAGVDLQDVETMRTAVRAQVAAGVVKRFDHGPEPVYYLAQDKHLVAAFFRNNAVHFFVMRAIGELVVLSSQDCEERGDCDILHTTDAAERLWESALQLRDLLKFEFFFGDKREFAERLEAEVSLIDPNWREAIADPDYALATLTAQPLHLAHRVLQPIFEAYQVVADQLLMIAPGAHFDKDRFVAECLGCARARRLRQQLQHSDAISNELFDTAIQLADNRGLLDPTSDNLTARRREFAAEIASWGRISRKIRVMAHVALNKVDAEVHSARGIE